MIKKIYISLFFISLALTGWNQIEVTNGIVAPPNDSLEIQNVGSPTDSSELINLKDIRNRKYLFFNSTLINNTANITIDTTLIPLKSGLLFYLVCTSSNSAGCNIIINNDTLLIRKNNSNGLDSGDILSGKILVMIYDQSQVLLLNPEKPTCPAGFVQVNENYCIQINESSGNFWIGARTCAANGARLCNWSEWYYACNQSAALGLINMTNNWELINQGQNQYNNIKVVGNGKCNITYHNSINATIKYRCCFNY